MSHLSAQRSCNRGILHPPLTVPSTLFYVNQHTPPIRHLNCTQHTPPVSLSRCITFLQYLATGAQCNGIVDGIGRKQYHSTARALATTPGSGKQDRCGFWYYSICYPLVRQDEGTRTLPRAAIFPTILAFARCRSLKTYTPCYTPALMLTLSLSCWHAWRALHAANLCCGCSFPTGTLRSEGKLLVGSLVLCRSGSLPLPSAISQATG